MVQAVPAVYRNVTPYLTIRDVPRAIDFYSEAFGAGEIRRQAMPDGGILHAEIAIGSSRIMMSEEMQEYGMKSPSALGGTPVTLQFFFEDVDAAWKRAVDAGAEVTMELMDAFWGDRYGVAFGHRWGLAQRVEELSDEEMEKRAEKWFASEGG